MDKLKIKENGHEFHWIAKTISGAFFIILQYLLHVRIKETLSFLSKPAKPYPNFESGHVTIYNYVSYNCRTLETVLSAMKLYQIEINDARFYAN